MFDDSDSSEDLEDSNNSVDEDNESEFFHHSQWVHAIESCSYQSKSSDSIRRDLGLRKLCLNTNEISADDLGWVFENQNREETLVVSFENIMFINEIIIYESLNPGCIVKLEVLYLPRDQFFLLWQRKSPSKNLSESPHRFRPILRRYRFPSNVVRLTFDPRATDRVGIQRIELVGSNKFDEGLHQRSIAQSMTQLFNDAMNQIQTDVQFGFNEKIIHAHRNILMCRSTYFRALLSNDFQEKTQTTPITLTDTDDEIFLQILHFIYTGTYQAGISLDVAMKLMIYANKINFLTAKNVAIEQLCRHLRANRQEILPVYCSIKPMSPVFNLLLEYIYEICSENLQDICKQREFAELDKEDLIDLVCQATTRRDNRKQQEEANRHQQQRQIEPLTDTDSSDDEE